MKTEMTFYIFGCKMKTFEEMLEKVTSRWYPNFFKPRKNDVIYLEFSKFGVKYEIILYDQDKLLSRIDGKESPVSLGMSNKELMFNFDYYSLYYLEILPDMSSAEFIKIYDRKCIYDFTFSRPLSDYDTDYLILSKYPNVKILRGSYGFNKSYLWKSLSNYYFTRIEGTTKSEIWPVQILALFRGVVWFLHCEDLCKFVFYDDKMSILNLALPKNEFTDKTMIKVHLKDGLIELEKRDLQYFYSNLIDDQLEQSDEIFIPMFKKKYFTHDNLRLLDYLDSKKYEKVLNYKFYQKVKR